MTHVSRNLIHNMLYGILFYLTLGLFVKTVNRSLFPQLGLLPLLFIPQLDIPYTITYVFFYWAWGGVFSPKSLLRTIAIAITPFQYVFLYRLYAIDVVAPVLFYWSRRRSVFERFILMSCVWLFIVIVSKLFTGVSNPIMWVFYAERAIELGKFAGIILIR
jgi:hypothetical protein